MRESLHQSAQFSDHMSSEEEAHWPSFSQKHHNNPYIHQEGRHQSSDQKQGFQQSHSWGTFSLEYWQHLDWEISASHLAHTLTKKRAECFFFNCFMNVWYTAVLILWILKLLFFWKFFINFCCFCFLTASFRNFSRLWIYE